MKFKNFIPALIFLLLAWILVFVTDLEDNPNYYPTMIGKDVAEFETILLYNNGTLSSEELKNNTILNFWASWCVACKAEHEYLMQMKEEGFPIYSINSGDKIDAAKEYLLHNGNAFIKTGIDPRRKLAFLMGVTGMPETFVIGKDGKIYFHHRGILTEDIVTKKIKPILDELNKKDF
ncbi:MAG: DsbE family thiol:disulfide interchange protein [Alphaproteobacteria bacterium CG11_big_fil_rev_8_21_14_0_20_44_7]|nr:MAG: DsbE family thiol:disulfide interchange protein [Alphaproteobacteria bacterium CG11_big_fil_rev_8_21_14_0_20_44_7]